MPFEKKELYAGPIVPALEAEGGSKGPGQPELHCKTLSQKKKKKKL
jgi:hypothetical protein